jgi:hypothetical protein
METERERERKMRREEEEEENRRGPTVLFTARAKAEVGARGF